MNYRRVRVSCPPFRQMNKISRKDRVGILLVLVLIALALVWRACAGNSQKQWTPVADSTAVAFQQETAIAGAEMARQDTLRSAKKRVHKAKHKKPAHKPSPKPQKEGRRTLEPLPTLPPED